MDNIPNEDSTVIRREQPGHSQVVDSFSKPGKSRMKQATTAPIKKGRPPKIVKTAMRMKHGYGGGGGGTGGGTFPGTTQGSGGNFYSPELSTDFLELPQSIDEQRNYYRFFAENDPFVAQALDLHTELPLSRIRIAKPIVSKTAAMSKRAVKFCDRWARDNNLLQYLLWITWEYHAIGEVNIFMEDTNPETPREVREEVVLSYNEEEGATEEWTERKDADEREYNWLRKNYVGFTGIRVIPPEQIHMESFPFTEKKLFEFVPDEKLRGLIGKSDSGDERSQEVVDTIDPGIVEKVRRGENIPLDTDPDCGSFLHYIARKKSQYAQRGQSLLQRCLRDLVLHDKLRQAQTSIASRHMTPMRIVWALDMSEADVDALREQVDLALADPDFSIISNFEIHWDEMGSNDRLLDLTAEYDLWSRRMYAGLGVTEALLSGESSYSGERINLEVINTRYIHLREMLQNFVEKYIFRPMCKRMGFIEIVDGREEVITPRLSFTRLGIRDNAEIQDIMFQLYNKNALDLRTILEALNLDADEVRERLEQDKLTINDALWNEMLRAIYSNAGNMIAENSNVVKILSDRLGVKFAKPVSTRFGPDSEGGEEEGEGEE